MSSDDKSPVSCIFWLPYDDKFDLGRQVVSVSLASDMLLCDVKNSGEILIYCDSHSDAASLLYS